jgi:hypothetical protein
MLARPSARTRRTVLAVVSAALVAAAVPALATPAAAETGDRLTMLDRSGGGAALAAWNNDGTADGVTTALAAGHYAFGYDVTPDGSLWVGALRTGTGTTDNADAAYALVLVDKDSGRTRVIASHFDIGAGPVISADGSTVWWMSGGAIWQYAVPADASAAGTYSKRTTRFAPESGERVVGMAVTPDKTRVAVVYRKNDGSSRLRATRFDWNGAFSPTPTPFIGIRTTNPTAFISADVTWLDSTKLLYATTNATGSVATSYTVVGTTTSPYGVPQAAAGATGSYRVRQDAGGDWWMWRDDRGADPLTSSYVKAANPLSPVEASNSFPFGDTTSSYAPVDQVPAALSTAVNRATSRAQLYMSQTVVDNGKRAAFLSYASYLTPLPGQTASADAFAVFRGELQYSTNPFATTPVWNRVTTSGASLISWGSYPAGSFNGTTPFLSRNTWFRWYYPGSAFAKADYTDGTIKVRVRPSISVSKARSGTRTRVSGTITRSGGTASLQRLSGGAWSTVAKATIGSAGGYSFGYRTLRSGNYRVWVPETTFWATNAKPFSI